MESRIGTGIRYHNGGLMERKVVNFDHDFLPFVVQRVVILHAPG
jgi:hypothetical protein